MDDDDDDISSTTVNKILHSVVLFILEGVSESATIPREVIAASPSKKKQLKSILNIRKKIVYSKEKNCLCKFI